MGGGAFNWLKTGRIGVESAKQAQIRIADLWKILSIVATEGRDEGGRGLASGSLSLISP
jgi:hypothetical protein